MAHRVTRPVAVIDSGYVGIGQMINRSCIERILESAPLHMTSDPASPVSETERQTADGDTLRSRRWLLRSSLVGSLAATSGCLAPPLSGDRDGSPTTELEARALATGLGIRSSVVRVGAGTGWIADPDVVATCSHVLGGETVTIRCFDGGRHRGTVLERDEERDIALLEVDTGGLEPLEAVNDGPREYQTVVKVGHPDAIGDWIVSFGRMLRTGDEELIVDVPCGPGDSGSPLVNLEGEVIGHVIGSTTIVQDRAGLDRPERLVQEYEGQRHVSRAHPVHHIVEHDEGSEDGNGTD